MDHEMLVNGDAVVGTSTFEIGNPATEEVVAEAPDCDTATLHLAVDSAHEAFPEWSRRNDRAELLLECARQLKGATVKLARLLTLEQGKPLRESMNEIMGAGVTLRYFAALSPTLDENEADPDAGFEIRRHALGVVAAITPWNYPVVLAMNKVAPALVAGNTVVLKPSPHTPLTTLALGELFREILPKGVLNILSGGDELGESLTSHPLVRKISLTGSVETGKAVARSAADDLKRFVLELGGNDAAIVLDDADPRKIAEDLFWGAFRNCGQVCLAIKRLYVHDAIYSEVVGELKQIAEGVVIGDGLEKRTQIGPLNNRAQFERVQWLVQESKKSGARIVTGGERRAGKGFFFQPTIIDEIEEGVALVDEEQFGPVLPVLRFSETDGVISRANATHFGLGGSVWSSAPHRAVEIATRLECGAVWINQHGTPNSAAPVGGWNWSGSGCENGKEGLDEYTRIQTVFG